MDEPIFGGGKNPRERVHKGLGWMCLVFGLLFFLGSLGQFGTQRVPGVLQRIAAAYFFASIIMFYTGWRGRLIWVIGLITGYYLIMKFVHAPEAFTLPPKEGWVRDAPAGAPFPGGLNAWIDWKIFGANQYSHQPDPEGLFSTIPSIATVLLGTLTGTWLKTKNDTKRKALILFGVGVGCIVLGYLMGFIFPVNKKIWSSSYVVFAGGWATAVLGLCMLLIDVAGFKKWAFPFVILGTNAILVYYLSTMMAIGLGKFGIKTWIYSNVIQKLYSSPELQSLTWALLYVILWVFLTYPLYRKRIFLKI
jgi:predicted acyltransferase